MATSRISFPEGIRVGAIVADPPWPIDVTADGEKVKHFVRRRTHYDRMTLDEIKSMGEDIDKIIHRDGHLWLWTTNPAMEMAFQVVSAWGFKYRTMATWRKSKLGLGWWLRSRTEHLILASRSTRLRANPGSFSTEIKGQWNGHSRKPDIADMVQALSPGPYLELFARGDEPRDGWLRLGAHSVPADAFGQEFMRGENDHNDGVIRGVGGLQIVAGARYKWLTKVIEEKPVIALEQNGRRVKIVIDGEAKPKWISLDKLRAI